MLEQRCMGWHLTSLGKSNAFSCTKRETMEEANAPMFKGDLWMAQRLRNGVFFLQGHDGEFTFMVKHGLLMGTSEARRVVSRALHRTFKRWEMNHQTPPHMMSSAPFTALRGSKVDGPWSGFADDLVIKDELPDHTAESAKDIIVSNAASVDETLAEDRYKQNLRKLEIVPSIRRYGEQKTTQIAGSIWKDPWPLFPREQQSGNRVQIAGDGGELVGAARVLVCTFTMDPQTFDLPVPNRECVDHKS